MVLEVLRWLVTDADADLSFLRPVQQLILSSPNMALDAIDGAFACGACGAFVTAWFVVLIMSCSECVYICRRFGLSYCVITSYDVSLDRLNLPAM